VRRGSLARAYTRSHGSGKDDLTCVTDPAGKVAPLAWIEESISDKGEGSSKEAAVFLQITQLFLQVDFT
jgi:hypothetical protein